MQILIYTLLRESVCKVYIACGKNIKWQAWWKEL